jgi:hypothetical protein
MADINQEEKSPGAVSADVPREAKTMVMTRTKEKVIGPRLVCTTASGESKIYPLTKQNLSSDALLKRISVCLTL